MDHITGQRGGLHTKDRDGLGVLVVTNNWNGCQRGVFLSATGGSIVPSTWQCE